MKRRYSYLDAAFAALGIVAFAYACITEKPYLAAFWGVYLICDAIRQEAAR